MNQIGFVSLGILIAAFIFQILTSRDRKIYKVPKFFFLGFTLAVSAYYFYLVYAQYLAWKNGGGVEKFLVPPYESISYVFGYHFIRFFMYYLVAFFFAFLLIVSMERLNKKSGDKFFEIEEPYWGALSIFILGNPAWNYAWIYYLVAVILIAVSVTGYRLLVTKENRRFSFYWLWLPVAILVILIKSFISF